MYDEGYPPTVRSKFNLLFNAVVVKYGGEPVQLFAPAAAIPSVTQPAQHSPTTVASTLPVLKVKLNQTIDQATEIEVPMLSATEIANYRSNFTIHNEGEPMRHEDVTDAQTLNSQPSLGGQKLAYQELGPTLASLAPMGHERKEDSSLQPRGWF